MREKSSFEKGQLRNENPFESGGMENSGKEMAALSMETWRGNHWTDDHVVQHDVYAKDFLL